MLCLDCLSISIDQDGDENKPFGAAGQPRAGSWPAIEKPAVVFRVDFFRHRIYRNPMEWDQEIDALGLLCPLPVLKARKRLKSMQKGEVLCLKADDPAAVIDVPHFCNEAGHQLLDNTETDEGRIYLIRKT